MKKLLVCILFVLFGTQVFAQDFDKGRDAYKAGDYDTAVKEWKPLAEQGNAQAQAAFGFMYKYGEGVLKDNAKAIKWWRLSAEQGYSYAQIFLGNMYKNGEGVLKDHAEAIKWYRLSAEQGDASAQSNLGSMYVTGEGILRDNITAHMWYNIASSNGHENAGKYRDELADQMTPEDISKATAMARECMASDYKKCGY